MPRAKRVPAHAGPQLFLISLNFLDQNTTPQRNLEGPFWFEARNPIFKILNTAISVIANIELKGSTFFSSLTMFTSCMTENIRKYLFQSLGVHNRSNSGSKHGF